MSSQQCCPTDVVICFLATPYPFLHLLPSLSLGGGCLPVPNHACSQSKAKSIPSNFVLQGPTSAYNQDGDRLQQLQQQQLQQQRIVDVEVVRGPVASSASSPHAEAPILAETEAATDRAASPSSQDLTGLSSS